MCDSAGLASELVVISDTNKYSDENANRNKPVETNQIDWKTNYELGLWEKLNLSYQGRYSDPHVTVLSDRAGTAFFWYVTVSVLYILIAYIVPFVLADWSDFVRYYAKVACWFVFIQVTANWACIRFINTAYQVTGDRSEPLTSRRPHYRESQRMPSHQDKTSEHSSGVTKRCVDGSALAVGDSCHDDRDVHDDDDDDNYGCRSGSREVDATLRWQWCDSCQHRRPPRSHHCIICNKCILKRDHHCYMTGRCIGYANQRHFIVLNFYMSLSAFGALVTEIWYLSKNFATRDSYADYFLPITAYRTLFGDIKFHELIMVSHMYALWWIGLTAFMFFVWQIGVTALGITSHEFLKGTRVRCTSTVAENFRSVFGPIWLINFVLPGQILYRQPGDGTRWENLKPT